MDKITLPRIGVDPIALTSKQRYNKIKRLMLGWDKTGITPGCDVCHKPLDPTNYQTYKKTKDKVYPIFCCATCRQAYQLHAPRLV